MPAEVQDVSRNGIWLLVQGREYFLPYSEYPWFKEAKLAAIFKLELLHGTHLHWPELDVDLELDSLGRPENYPLVYKQDRSVVADRPLKKKAARKSTR